MQTLLVSDEGRKGTLQDDLLSGGLTFPIQSGRSHG